MTTLRGRHGPLTAVRTVVGSHRRTRRAVLSARIPVRSQQIRFRLHHTVLQTAMLTKSIQTAGFRRRQRRGRL
jgi:hypothetical protein